MKCSARGILRPLEIRDVDLIGQGGFVLDVIVRIPVADLKMMDSEAVRIAPIFQDGVLLAMMLQNIREAETNPFFV